MTPDDWVKAWRTILPPNMDRWVVFRHGTIYVVKPGAICLDVASEAVEFLREHGPVVIGSDSGDFTSMRLKDNLGWFVRYAKDGIFNFVPSADFPDDTQDIVVGLAGRNCRHADGIEPVPIHVETPTSH